MNKKIARKKKKLISQIRHHRVLPNGRVLTADGKESLLGNLAPVKHIPMLPWKRVIAFPQMISKISVATEGENSWLYKLFTATSGKAHDLIGFTPVKALLSTCFDEIGEGKVGIAVQVVEIEPPEKGRAIVHLKGICRYENTGFLPSTEDHFNINIRWFEDNREADSQVKPEFEKCMRFFQKISDVISGAGIEGFERRVDNSPYNFMGVQYLSFSLLEGAKDYFEEEEKLKMLLTRSTRQRFKKLNEYLEEFLAETEHRFKDRAKS